MTDEDFERAIHGSSKVVQNPAQHLHVSARTDSQTPPTADKKNRSVVTVRGNVSFADIVDTLENARVV